MKEFTIAAADDGRKLDKWLAREMPAVSMGQRQKFYRQKKFRLNGRHPAPDARLTAGDVLQIYLNDELFVRPQRKDPFLSKIQPRLNVLYEDSNLLIVDKQPGLSVHPDAHEKVNTLITHIQAYLYQKGEYEPGGFAPALCNRIDRFTGGIVIAAKTQAALHIINQKIRDREIQKLYLCIALGEFQRSEGMLDNYIIKEDGHKKVRVSPRMETGAQRAQTKYRVLTTRGELNLVECELLTGRTHQIRAQMAHAKHPLLGDGQYGDAQRNRKYGREFQALYACRMVFEFTTDAGILDPLNGLEITVPQVRFVREYFPEYRP